MTAQGQAMVASRRLDSQLKRERVAAAVDALARTGRELSIAAIARHAGVSRKFIYAHRDLRAQIEQRARQATAATTARAAADGRVTIASLRADLANANASNHRLRQQVRALEQRLSEALGRDIADQLESPFERPDQLRGQLQDAQAQIFELQEQLADYARSSTPSARSTASCWPTATDRRPDRLDLGSAARSWCSQRDWGCGPARAGPLSWPRAAPNRSGRAPCRRRPRHPSRTADAAH